MLHKSQLVHFLNLSNCFSDKIHLVFHLLNWSMQTNHENEKLSKILSINLWNSKKTSETKSMDKKKYFEIFKAAINYISTIESLICIHVYYSATTVWLNLPRHFWEPVKQTLGTQILQLHFRHIFTLNLNHC